jgi:hypothetical protein
MALPEGGKCQAFPAELGANIMLCKSILVYALLLMSATQLYADEFVAMIRKVSDRKVTFIRVLTKDEVTMPVIDKVKVLKLKFNKQAKKSEPDGDLPDGLQNENFKNIGKAGIQAQIVTDPEGKAITEIRVVIRKPTPKAPDSTPPKEPELSRKDLDSFSYVMMGLKDNRNRLKTGLFKARGTYSETDGKGADRLRGKVEIFCAFDFPGDRIRFDRSLPMPRSADTAKQNESEQGEESGNTAKTQIILTKKEVISFVASSGGVFIYSAEEERTKRLQGLPFDVRALGLYLWYDFLHYKRFEQIHDTISKSTPLRIERDADSRCKITWDFGGSMLVTAWIDEKKGFTVLRSETRLTKGRSASVQPDFKTEVTWELREDVFVPKTLKHQNQRGQILLSYDLVFEWESVNQPLDDRHFKLDGLGIKERTPVKNTITGTLEVLEPD